jgi:hypothetical protein
MCIRAMPMGSSGKVFIKYESNETFTIENCTISMMEILYLWESPKNLWNYTFVSLGKGTFVFENTNFLNIKTIGTNNLINATIEENKQFFIKNCTFTNCGSDGEGVMIYIKSSNFSSSQIPSLSVINSSHFLLCFGTIFDVLNQIINVDNCLFKNVTSKTDGGVYFIFFFFCKCE